MLSVKEKRSQLELWKLYFMDILYEITDLQERMSGYLSSKNAKKNAADVQNFHSQFTSRLDAITGLVEKLKICDEALDCNEPDMLLSEDQLLKCASLDEEMDQFQAMYNALKEDFRQKIKILIKA